MVVRALTPLPIPLPALNVLSLTASSGGTVCGISLDRKTTYFASGSTLKQSVDDGVTLTNVTTTAFGTSTVQSLVETDDGEAFVTTVDAAAFPGRFWKSSGWAASHTAATWTQVFVTASGARLNPVWGGGHYCTFGNDRIRPETSKVGFVNEYGVQTANSTPDQTKPTHFALTQDYGATWTVVLDLQTRFPGVGGLHAHAAAVDPWWDRLWATWGDNATDGASNSVMGYSDDRGATWTSVPLPTEWLGQNNLFQATTIAVTEDSILFYGDPHGGVLRIERRGYRRMSPLTQLGLNSPRPPGTQMIGQSAHRNRTGGGPLLLAASSSSEFTSFLTISEDAGRTLTELWRGPTATINAGYALVQCFGPTALGRIVGSDSAGATLRAEIVPGELGTLDGFATLTGDGTTTVFTIPHGLPNAPSRFAAYPQNHAASQLAPVVTATASNFVLTFTAAPANGASLVYATRAGA